MYDRHNISSLKSFLFLSPLGIVYLLLLIFIILIGVIFLMKRTVVDVTAISTLRKQKESGEA